MRVLVLSAFVCLSALIALRVGAYAISWPEILPAVFGHGDGLHVMIVQDLRLPRTLLGLIIGAGLGASGAALQGYTRNALADPGVLGFSATASFAAVTALYFGKAQYIAPAALFGAFLGALLLLIVAGRSASTTKLVLAGVGLAALATSLTGLLMNFAPNPWALSEIVYWLMGSLRNASWTGLLVCAVLSGFGIFILIVLGPDLRTLSLGEDTAQSLGVSLPRLRILLVVGVSLCIGSGVAMAGAIGFVGLFIPHILRKIMTADPAKLIPFSALGGAGFLVLADSLSQIVSTNGTVLYLGILTALIGAPFFIWIAITEKSV